MARREFPGSVKAQIVLRATNGTGHVFCEGCGLVLGKRPYNIDHTIPDALFRDKSRKLTADDGKLLGKKCCHDPKTHEHDIPAIAEAKRREAKDMGFATRPVIKIARRPPVISERTAKNQTRERMPPLPPRVLFARGELLQPLNPIEDHQGD